MAEVLPADVELHVDEEKVGAGDSDDETAPLTALFRFATAFDIFLMIVGSLGCFAVGAAQPVHAHAAHVNQSCVTRARTDT